MITIKTNPAALNQKLRNLPRRYPAAASAALNRVAERVRTAAIREIQADVQASSQKAIRGSLMLSKANESKPTASISARSRRRERIPIFQLGPRPRTVTKRRPPGGVRYGPMLKLLPGSFIARLQNGKIGVFRRRSKKRTDFVELFGPSIALVFSRRAINAKLRELIRERLPVEMARAFKFVRG